MLRESIHLERAQQLFLKGCSAHICLQSPATSKGKGQHGYTTPWPSVGYLWLFNKHFLSSGSHKAYLQLVPDLLKAPKVATLRLWKPVLL